MVKISIIIFLGLSIILLNYVNTATAKWTKSDCIPASAVQLTGDKSLQFPMIINPSGLIAVCENECEQMRGGCKFIVYKPKTQTDDKAYCIFYGARYAITPMNCDNPSLKSYFYSP